MAKSNNDPVNVLSLFIALALVVVGYLLGLLSLKPFWVAGAVMCVVVSAALLTAGWIVRRGQKELVSVVDNNLTEHSDQLLEEIAKQVTGNFGLNLQKTAAYHDNVLVSLRRMERAVFDHLAVFEPRLAGPTGGSEVAAITRAQAEAIEAMADEVWVYAYDMSWDAEEFVLGGAVEDNLREAAKYRFLIPDREDVKQRVRILTNRFRKIPDVDIHLKFRIRNEEVPFAKFAITIYNPHYEKSHDELMNMTSNPCVVLFPHLGRKKPESFDPFIKLNGSIVSDYELEFSQLWQSGVPYEPDPLEKS